MTIVAKTLIFDVNDDILVLRRSATHPIYAFQDDLPGGIVEVGETSIIATQREVLEEVGLDIDISCFKHVYSRQISSAWIYEIFEVYLTEARPQITLSWEHDKAEWVSANDLIEREKPAGTDFYMVAVAKYLQVSAS